MFCVFQGEEEREEREGSWRRQLAEMLDLTASQIQWETSVRSNTEEMISFRLILLMAGTEGDPSLWI